MAIHWGGWNGRLRVGIDVDQSPSSVNHGTTSVDLTIKFYVQTDGYNFADNQELVLSGDVSGTPDFRNDMTGTNEKMLVATRTKTVSLSFNSRKSLSFSARLRDAFNGATPSKTRNYTAPYRPAAKPDKVSRPSVSPDSNGRYAQVDWSRPGDNGANIDQYEVLVEHPGGANVDKETSGTDMTQRMEGMSPGGSYTARVRAHNSAGWGPWSDTRSFSTPALPPDKPARPTVTDITATACRVAYSNPASNGASINAWQIRLEDGSGSKIRDYDDGNGPPEYLGVDELTRATDYRARVRVKNSAGWSRWSDADPFTTDTTKPAAPPPPTFGTITDTTAALRASSANDNGGLELTNVRWRYSRNANMSGATTVSSGSWAGRSIGGLQRATRYYAQTAAYNADGWSEWSGTASFTTAPTKPTPPGRPSVSNIGVTDARATWTPPSDNGGRALGRVQVQYAPNPSFSGASHVTLSSWTTARTIVGLDPGTEYWTRVRVENAVGWSGWSDHRSFRTQASVKVGDGTNWVDALVYVGAGNDGWQLCEIRTGTGSGWTT